MPHPDRARVLVRPFLSSEQRAARICAHVMALPEGEVHSLLDQVQAEFAERHLKIAKFLRQRFEQIRSYLPAGQLLEEGVAARRPFYVDARSKPPRCSIPRLCRTRISPTCRAALCALFSVCAPPARDLFPRSAFAPAT